MKNEPNIEIAADEPDLSQITHELEQAQTDATWFYQRMQQAREWWSSRWPGQTVDGRKWPGKDRNEEEDCFPWQGSADARIRTVGTLIREHVMGSKYAFFKAKIQATSPRPMIHAGQTNKATKLLRWRLYNHMWSELIREVPQAFNWWWGYGLGLLGIYWEQSRRLEYVDISLPIIEEILGSAGGPDGSDTMLWLMDAFQDPNQESALVGLVQQLSPVVSRSEARQIVKDLQQARIAKLPIAYPYKNKPLWVALKPVVDCLWPSEESDIQAGRWYADLHEWVSETELEDRITTEGYDADFVELAKQHKGEPALGGNNGIYPNPQDKGSRRNLIHLVTFYYKATMEGTPICLKTVYHPGITKKGGQEQMYAKHGPCEYKHGLYPVVTFARRFEDRRLLGSVGIAEEAYTDEQDIKTQQDGLSNRTELVNRPVMIVPQNKVAKIKGAFKPGKILGVARAREVDWAPLPPTDQTPVAVMQAVYLRLERRYPLFGLQLDEALKQLYREEVASDTLATATLAIEQTWQLMQQYEVDEEVAQVAGQLTRPFPVDRQEILGKHEISATIDMRALDSDYNEKKFGLIGQAMVFKQEGALFDLALEAIDPDAAEILQQSESSPAALEREKAEERAAVSNALNGMEDPLPQFGNWVVRRQELLKHTVYSQNPLMMQRIKQSPDSQKILMNRLEFYERQIQQHQENPQIGRALQTRTFAQKQAPELTMGNGQGGGI